MYRRSEHAKSVALIFIVIWKRDKKTYFWPAVVEAEDERTLGYSSGEVPTPAWEGLEGSFHR